LGTLSESYNLSLVLFSIVIAIVSSYTAMDLSDRIIATEGRTRRIWLIVGAIAMGIGITSVHFVGMLALWIPISVTYNILIVIGSLAVAIIVSFIALWVITRKTMSTVHLWLSAVFMGLGMSAMHYIGMRSMEMSAVTHYHHILALLSVLIGIAGSFTALMFVFKRRNKGNLLAGKFLSALIMGSTIVAMHFTAMRAAYFVPNQTGHTFSSFYSTEGYNIGISTMAVQMLVMLFVFVDNRKSAQIAGLHEQPYLTFFVHNPNAMFMIHLDGQFANLNPAAEKLIGYRKKELLSMSVRDLISQQDLEQVRDSMPRIKLGESLNKVLSVIRKGGQCVQLNIIIVPHVRDHKIIGALGIARDITEYNKAAREIIEKSAKARHTYLQDDPGKNLRMIMAEMDINTSELAKMSRLSLATISNLRTGKIAKPQVSTARSISGALGVVISDIWPDLKE
jgi:PAS domain S-box-containing protein